MLPGHRIELLFGGAQAYPAMLGAIASARQEVLLESFIWSSDENGRRFVDAVCIKAQEGVHVRCIIDGAGSFGFASSDAQRMRSAGVRLSIFHPVGPWRRHWGWQVRDHRKLLIVDGRVAFTGGMNLGDEYAPKEWHGRGWNDVQARVEGPAVRELQKLFEIGWRYAEPENWMPPKRLPHATLPEAIAIHGSTTMVQVLAVGRFFGRRIIQRHLRYAIRQARERVFIEAAYFVPNRTLRAALLRAGVRIFEWLPGMLHAKTLCIDGVWSTVGSYNLDSRSLLYNWEVALEVLDAGVAGALEAKFTADLEQCEPVDPERWRRRGLWQKMRERFFYFFRLWL
jgi:cardiolipin synthase